MRFIRLEYDFDAKSLGRVEVKDEVYALATVAPSGLMKADRIWLREILEQLVKDHGHEPRGAFELTDSVEEKAYQVKLGDDAWAVTSEDLLNELLEAFHAHLIIED